MDLPKELLNDLEARRVLFFVGSGASLPTSRNVGFPLAGDLGALIHSELLRGPPDPSLSLQQIAQRAIWACGGSRAPLEGILSRIYSSPSVRPMPHHEALALLKLPIVTTNYDQLIEQAYRAKGVPAPAIVDDSDVPSAVEPYVIKIHGCVSRPSTCVVSEEDYYKWLSTESELKNLVRALFTTLRVVFIGYSIGDVNFRLLLSELRRKLGPALRRPYVVAPMPDSASYNYEFLTYALGAQFIDYTAEQFITSVAAMFGKHLTPYADKYRQQYFEDPAIANCQAFIPFAAERLIEDLQSGSAGPLLLDHEIVRATFANARGREEELYSTARATAAPPGMVYVPSGEFIMGGSRLGNERLRVERIPHGFFIQEAAVTNAEYREFVEWISRTKDHTKCHPNEPRDKDHWPDPDFSGSAAQDVKVSPLPNDYFTNTVYDEFPAVNIDWWDAFAFAAWRGWRLPTEKEWEKAARGIDGRMFPYGDLFDPSICNVAESGIRQPVAVRSYARGKSPYGCYEMSGNVWEWCADLFHVSESGASPTRVLRGGSCTRGHVKAGTAFRNGRHAGERWLARGFRCALDEKN